MTDDGFNIGILYRGERRPYQIKAATKAIDIGELEKDFAL
jgi:2-oxoglutarate ferredoxin oxidoreductase subunit beta